MTRILGFVRLLLKLIIDDGVFAFAIVSWLGVVWALVGWIRIRGEIGAIVLCLGLGAVLTESVLRAARRSVRTRPAKPALHSGP